LAHCLDQPLLCDHIFLCSGHPGQPKRNCLSLAVSLTENFDSEEETMSEVAQVMNEHPEWVNR
jgi:hypothetical protein